MNLELILEELWQKSRFASYFYQGVDITEEKGIPTLALTLYHSRLVLFFNPDFINTLSNDEITGLLIHEMMHIVLNHDHRAFPEGKIYLQNLAQDMVINTFLKENSKIFFSHKTSYSTDVPPLILPAGLPEIPQDFFKETNIEDPTWEEVYYWLKNQPPEKLKEFKFISTDEKGISSGKKIKSSIEELEDALKSLDLSYNTAPEEKYTRFKNMDGLFFETDGGDMVPTGIHVMKPKTEKNILESKINHFITTAKRDETCRGERIFQEITAIIEAPQKTDTSWENRLKSIVDLTAQSMEWEYTYNRFNKRYFSQGIYSPGRSFKQKEAITVAVDLSGSMVMKPYNIESAFGIIEELLKRFRVYLLCLDERVFIPEKQDNSFVKSSDAEKPYLYKKGDWKYIKSGSSGTTYFESLFNDFMKGHNELLIVITDGYIYDMDRLEKYKNTLWLISEDRDEKFNPPFGKVIKISRPDKGIRLKGRMQ